jgi:hypothetical protein
MAAPPPPALDLAASADTAGAPDTSPEVDGETMEIGAWGGGTLRARFTGLVERFPTQKILHDLTKLFQPNNKRFLPILIAGGVVVGFGLVGLVIGIFRKNPSEVDGAGPGASGSASVAASALPPPGAGPAPLAVGRLEGCSLGGISHTVAPHVTVPSVELVGLSNAIGLAFATSAKDGMAVELDPQTLAVSNPARVHSAASIKRVVPDPSTGKIAALLETDHVGGLIQQRRAVDSTIDLGVVETDFVVVQHGKDTYAKLWTLEGEGAPEAARAVPIAKGGQTGYAIAYRRQGAIWLGAVFGDPPSLRGELAHVAGLGPVIGSPAIAAIGDTVLVAWADKPSGAEGWGIRWLRWTAGEAAHEPQTFTPPGGGLGENAMSPALTSVGTGRFLFMWTEGPAAGHQVRAQTLDLNGATLGDAMTISDESVNAGQAMGAVLPDGHGVVAYLAAKGKGFELVVTPVVCPVPAQ